tara:strand:+ start:3878 stop:6946 length:3069 start_codon:yes stop_codon:yes gene_type:complete
MEQSSLFQAEKKEEKTSSIWTEKYRPQTFEQIKGQQEIVSKIKAFVESGNMPHLLFSGPAGVGKCVTGETQIVLGSGEIKQISQCYNEKITSVMTLDPQGKISPGKVAYFHKEKASSLQRIETRSGKHLSATPEHPLLVLKDGIPTWTEVSKIPIGSSIAIPEKLSFTEKEEIIDWRSNGHFWAALKNPKKVLPNSLYLGARKKILKYLEANNYATNAQIATGTKIKKNVVAWATSNLLKENILTAKGKNPLVYSLKEEKTKSKIIPFSLVDNNDLVLGIRWKSKIHSPRNEISYFSQTTTEFYEWLGLVYGDGHVRNSSIRFYNNDASLRRKFTQLSNIIFGNNIIISEIDSRCPYIEIRRCRVITQMLETFYSIPINQAKAHIITIPSALYTASDEKVSSFIRGFYESDGSCGNNIIEISTASESFANGLSYLLLRWGIHSRIIRRNSQSYLKIHDVLTIKRFISKINPSVKIPMINRLANTNIDLLDLASRPLNNVMQTLGIKQLELGRKHETSYVFERGRASRCKIQSIYKKTCEISRSRLELGLEALSICKNIPLDINFDLVLSQLSASSYRNQVGKMCGIRYDRLNDYYGKKRQPNLDNFIKILKAMKSLHNSHADSAYNELTQLLLLKQKIVPALSLLNVTYEQIASIANDSPGNVNYILNNNGLSLQGLQKIPVLLSAVVQILESKLLNENLVSDLEMLQYLSMQQVRWDKIISNKTIQGEEVYDLNVHETHNFVGGSGAIILHNTTLSLVIAKQLFGDNWRQNTLELNASDERGIDVIRVKVKDFARTRSIGDVPFKLIYLDESDALTRDAQQALRRTMENYTKTCRFILSCNYSSKIIDPIQSRCAVFRFKPLPEDQIAEVINKVASQEGLTIAEEAKKALFEVCGGDCRRLENIMQSCAVINKNIDLELVYSMSSVAKPKEVNEVLSVAVTGDFPTARKKLLDLMLNYGLSGLDIIRQIQKEIWNLSIDDRTKVKLVNKVGEIEFRMVEGSDEYIQLESLLAYVMLAGTTK